MRRPLTRPDRGLRPRRRARRDRGIGAAAPARSSDTKLSLVAYSTPREAYGKLIPLFQKTPAGDGVELHPVLRRVGRAGPRGQGGPRRPTSSRSRSHPTSTSSSTPGSSTRSGTSSPTRASSRTRVVVFVVRDGNPKKIKGWNDLLKPGVEVVTPNPFTSGGARWNVMAAYGAWRKLGKTDKQAQANLLKLFKNVVVQDTSARDALQHVPLRQGRRPARVRERGARSRGTQGQDLQFVIPKPTILIENPIAVIEGQRRTRTRRTRSSAS